MDSILLDIATAPIDDAARYLDGTVSAPRNYKDPEKIREYVRTETARLIDSAATDWDLARITAVGWSFATSHFPLDGSAVTHAFTRHLRLCKTEAEEKVAIEGLGRELEGQRSITYGGLNFDLPMLMRRAAYLGVKFPALNLDRYRSPHIDLCNAMAFNDPTKRRSLGWFVKRLGWDLVKPLSGEEESQIFQHGKWEDLEASVLHDLKAIEQLAVWTGVLR